MYTIKPTGTAVANAARLDMWGRRQRRIALIFHWCWGTQLCSAVLSSDADLISNVIPGESKTRDRSCTKCPLTSQGHRSAKMCVCVCNDYVPEHDTKGNLVNLVFTCSYFLWWIGNVYFYWVSSPLWESKVDSILVSTLSGKLLANFFCRIAIDGSMQLEWLPIIF